MTKYTKGELTKLVQFNSKIESYLLMPNEIIDMLVKDEELNQKDAPDIAVAYSYVYLITWMYRYAKYGQMGFDETNVKAIKKMLGLSPTNNTYDYIFKKNGVLDRLEITKTLSMTETPIEVWFNKDEVEFPQFVLFTELVDDMKSYILKGQTMKKKSFKYPMLAMEERNPIDNLECNGTFYGGGKDFTHMIPFEVFVECMTNDKLGCVGFYLHSFIQCRQGANDMVSISLDGITTYSGIKPTTRDKYMKELKAFGLIGVAPEDFCLERGEYKTESSTYWTKQSSNWSSEPNYNFPKRNVYHVTSHIDYVEAKATAVGIKSESIAM